MRLLVERTQGAGVDFFEGLVRGLAESLGVRFAYIFEIVPQAPSRVRALASWKDGRAGESLEYELQGTPCENVVTRQLCYYRQDVAAAFPQDRFLVEHGIDSYLGAPLRAANGDPLGLLVVMHDQAIDPGFHPQALLELFAGRAAAELERKRAEDFARESRERLEAALAGSGMGTFRWSFGASEVSWDENLDRLFGLPVGQTIRSLQGFIDVVHPHDRARVIEQCERCANDGADFDMAFRVVWPDGSVHWLADRGKTFRDARGRPLYMTGACADITQLKAAEEALRESESRFRLLADALPHMVWVARGDGYHEFFNQRWYAYTGLSERDCMDGGWADPLHPDDRQRARDQWDLALRTGERYEIEYRFRNVHGEYRWFLGRALPVRDRRGKIIRWFGTCTDIEDQKRAEESLREGDRRKNEFLAMLGHELRNPLAPIRNAVQILQQSDVAGDQAAWAAEVIDRQSQHLARLVDDLLDVSRITRGKIDLRREVIDVRASLEHAIETSRPLIDSRGHRLEVSWPDSPLWVSADPVRLSQIVLNLLNNAAKYTDERGRIWLSARREKDAAEIRVRDDGIGIPGEMLPHVFELFTQAKGAQSRADGGIGIGLTLVHRLVAMHGGSIEALSDGPGQGSEFIVRLPLAHQTPPAEARPAKPSGPASQGRRILVVDDNVDSAKSLAVLLSVLGNQVETVHDGPAALALAERIRPDIIFLDIGLPLMDGRDVARALRAGDARHEGLLIAMTGYGENGDRRRSLDAGFDVHLTKPIELHDIEAILAAGDDRPSHSSQALPLGTGPDRGR